MSNNPLRWTNEGYGGGYRAEDPVTGWAHTSVAYVVQRDGSRWTVHVYLVYPQDPAGFVRSSEVMSSSVRTLAEGKRWAGEFRRLGEQKYGTLDRIES